MKKSWALISHLRILEAWVLTLHCHIDQLHTDTSLGNRGAGALKLKVYRRQTGIFLLLQGNTMKVKTGDRARGLNIQPDYQYFVNLVLWKTNQTCKHCFCKNKSSSWEQAIPPDTSEGFEVLHSCIKQAYQLVLIKGFSFFQTIFVVFQLELQKIQSKHYTEINIKIK